MLSKKAHFKYKRIGYWKVNEKKLCNVNTHQRKSGVTINIK